jgi:hypothetical protein
VELELSADAPTALVAVRLNDVAPDGTSLRVTYGLLNLTHYEGHEFPQALAPGKRYRVRVQLNDIAHNFPAGHRVALALSTSYWPIAWPSPQAVNLTVYSGVSSLTLPVRPPDPADTQLAPFAEPEVAPGPSHKPLRPLPFRRTVELDLATNETVYTLSSDGGEFGGHSLAHLEEIAMDLGYTFTKRHRIGESDPLTAKTEIVQKVRMHRDGWSVRVESRVRLVAAADTLRFTAELEAYENEELVANPVWDTAVPRKLF